MPPAFAILATFVGYLRSFGNGFVYDDHEMIQTNLEIAKWSFLWKPFTNDLWYFRPNGRPPKSSYYRPLEDVWLGLNYHLFGLDPVAWHVTIVLLHLLVVWMVYLLALRLTKAAWPSAIAAAMFGLAPLHAQGVVWPTAIPFPMTATFELAALLLFMNRERAPSGRLALSLAAFLGALFSHESAVVFPALISAYVFLLEPPPARDEPAIDRGRRALLASAPYVVPVLLYLAARAAVLGFITRAAPHNHATWTQVVLSIPLALSNYLAIIAVPWIAGPAHPLDLVSSPASTRFYLPLLGLISLAVAGYLLLGRHPHRRLYLFLLAWFFIELAPVLDLHSLVPDGLLEDRYLYLPSVAVFIFAADLAAGLISSTSEGRQLAALLAATVIATYGLVLWQVEHYWHDEIALFGRCLEEYPDSPLCHGRLGMAYMQRGISSGAEKEFLRTLELKPDDYAAMYNLGHLYASTGHPAAGEPYIARAIAGLSDLPANVYVELAQVAEAANDRAGADRALDEGERTNPGSAPPLEILRAQLVGNRGDLKGAENILQRLTDQHPEFAPGWAALGSVLNTDGHPDAGLPYVEHALAMSPGDPSFRMLHAQILRALGRNREALEECQLVLRIQPNNRDARALAAEITKR